MNRPREVLMMAAVEDAHRHVVALRERGWPVEVIAVSEDEFYGLRIEIDLRGVPVPVESVITDPEGGDPPVGPVVCYACPMFEGAAHMPDAANHRPDPEGGDKE